MKPEWKQKDINKIYGKIYKDDDGEYWLKIADKGFASLGETTDYLLCVIIELMTRYGI